MAMRIRAIALLLVPAALAACAQGEQLGASEDDGGPAAAEDLGDGDERAPGSDSEGLGSGPACAPGARRSCYSGPTHTGGVGACHAGKQTCLEDGSGFGPCEGEVIPLEERCGTALDDDCDGEVNEGCACVPGATQACYQGPPETEGVGVCTGGVQTCAEDGQWGPCDGQVLPAPEDLNTPEDDDCTGDTHDSVCEQNGILVCPTNNCQALPSCGSWGNCTLVWECVL